MIRNGIRRRIWMSATLALAAMGSGGCVAVLAAGAGGAVAWQGGKAVSEEGVPMARAVDATLAAFRAEKIELKDKVVRSHATQLRGERADGAKVAVDAISTGEKNVRIEVRIGVGDKSAARDLLYKIKKRL